MNKLFIDDLTERLGYDLDVVHVCTQEEAKRKLIEMDMCDQFPMVCYEYTSDSGFEADIDQSSFLNEPFHEGTWILGVNDDQILFVLNLTSHNSTLDIDVFEVNSEQRGTGLGGNIVAVVESEAEAYFDTIEVSPFDTAAIKFWEHMEYEEGGRGHWIKEL